MKVTKTRVLGIRLTEFQVLQLQAEAHARNISLSNLGRLLCELLIVGQIKIN